jgi:hypothetical protein
VLFAKLIEKKGLPGRGMEGDLSGNKLACNSFAAVIILLGLSVLA